jgi:PAS domain S-box-containing protein
MGKRLWNVLAIILLLVSATLVVWQGSFNLGSFRPDNPEVTFVYFAVSILIFLLMLALLFRLARTMFKLWVERRAGRPGSRIRTKLIAGAWVLSFMPVFFMVLFSYYVMNRTLKSWFIGPTEHVVNDYVNIKSALNRQTRAKALAEAQLLAGMPEAREQISSRTANVVWLEEFCQARGIAAARILPAESMQPVATYGRIPGAREAPSVAAAAPIMVGRAEMGSVVVIETVPMNVAEQREVQAHADDLHQLNEQQKLIRKSLVQILGLIALFILFIATWLAQFLARQISNPITALLRAAEEVSHGNLNYRLDIHAIDELAQLVAGFNRMTADLEANRAELDSRRRFTETILESIPTGVISVDSGGAIQRVNKALGEMLPGTAIAPGMRLDEFLPREDAAELRYLMNRARRTGLAAGQFELVNPARTLHLAVTVSAIERYRNAGFVIVVEDTSDLLRAQKTAAWSEVARRVAHEIRNPLTPITLSAERILRQVDRGGLPPAIAQMLRECASTILDETSSVKRLVDEFSQFSRLPAAQPVLCDLNDVVRSGLNFFDGRLEGINVSTELTPGLPLVSVDPEQFKRVIINLVDNAAEAMQDSHVRILNVETRPGIADTVEIVIADSGCGVTPDQKEKLFLPYFSTKGRGTGLGLAIVSHILAEHAASIRVDDNKPSGAMFTIEVPVASTEEAANTMETVVPGSTVGS